jgi:hypothetical protein
MAENQFLSYQEAQAHLQLKFPINHELNGDKITGLESIKLITDTDSYNYEMRDFKRIYVAGCGPKSSPGHPCSHQSHFDQKMINISNYQRNLIHVIHETGSGKIVYRGLYKIHEITKQLTHAGWAYYQMELHRYVF